MKTKTKTTRIIRNILLVLLAVLFLIVSGTYIFNKIKTAQEIELLKANGYYNPVSVGDYSLNVAIFGKQNGKHTIVSLAGLGMADYSVTERRMTECLEKENTVVFIDRAGYGLSDDTDNEMTIDYIVEDYRKALNNAGIKAPYILMPHSIGGVYASYWVSKYPDEIEAIAASYREEFSQEDTDAGQIYDFLEHCSYTEVCTRMLFKEALGRALDEPKPYELRAISEIVNAGIASGKITGWKPFKDK